MAGQLGIHIQTLDGILDGIAGRAGMLVLTVVGDPCLATNGAMLECGGIIIGTLIVLVALGWETLISMAEITGVGETIGDGGIIGEEMASTMAITMASMMDFTPTMAEAHLGADTMEEETCLTIPA